MGGGGDGGDGDRDGRRVKRPRAIFRFSRVRCAGKGEMVARRSVEESSIDVIEGTGVDQYRKIKNIQTSQRSHRVRVGMNCRDYYGPWRCTLERAKEDLVIMHTCRGWITKKTKLLELLKEAGNGVVRRGGRKPREKRALAGKKASQGKSVRQQAKETLEMFMHSWKSFETSFLSLPPSLHHQSFSCSLPIFYWLHLFSALDSSLYAPLNSRRYCREHIRALMYKETGQKPGVMKKGSEFYTRTAEEYKKHPLGTCISGPGARAHRMRRGSEAPGPGVHIMSVHRPWAETPGLPAHGMSFHAGRKPALRGASCRPWLRTLTEARS